MAYTLEKVQVTSNVRNLGAAFANVLIGIQEETGKQKSLIKHLQSLDYEFIEESDNVGYINFLK